MFGLGKKKVLGVDVLETHGTFAERFDQLSAAATQARSPEDAQCILKSVTELTKEHAAAVEAGTTDGSLLGNAAENGNAESKADGITKSPIMIDGKSVMKAPADPDDDVVPGESTLSDVASSGSEEDDDEDKKKDDDAPDGDAAPATVPGASGPAVEAPAAPSPGGGSILKAVSDPEGGEGIPPSSAEPLIEAMTDELARVALGVAQANDVIVKSVQYLAQMEQSLAAQSQELQELRAAIAENVEQQQTIIKSVQALGARPVASGTRNSTGVGGAGIGGSGISKAVIGGANNAGGASHDGSDGAVLDGDALSGLRTPPLNAPGRNHDFEAGDEPDVAGPATSAILKSVTEHIKSGRNEKFKTGLTREMVSKWPRLNEAEKGLFYEVHDKEVAGAYALGEEDSTGAQA